MAATHISVLSADPVGDTESLADWLRGEPGLAGRVRRSGCPPGPNELGAVLDTVTVAVGAGGSVTALVASLRTWLAQPRRSDIRLKIRRPGGAAVEIDAKRVKSGDLERLLHQAVADMADMADMDGDGGRDGQE